MYYKWREYLSVYLVLITVLNILLLFFPLTNVFGYEFAVVNAILISLLAGFYTTQILKRNFISNQPTQLSYLFVAYIYMLMAPFAISLVYSVLTGFCSFFNGTIFFIVITVPSVIIGGCLAALNFNFVKKFSYISFFILYLFVLIFALIEFYFNPQIYFYNPIFGYFSGTIHDEALSVSSILFLYRFCNLIFFGLFLLVFTYKINYRKKVFKSAILFIFIASVFIYLSPSFGFSTTSSSLQSELSLKTESEHFIVYSDPSTDKKELKSLILSSEFYHHELKQFYRVSPVEKFIIYLFKSQEHKKELFGSGNADVAKPWLKQVYTSEEIWELTLKHELAHCFSAEFGTGIFKVADWINPALIEGSAEAADGFSDERSIDYLAALAFKNGYKVDLKQIFSGFSFLKQASSLAYTFSGSFSKYLIDNYGIQKFKDIYADNNFEKIYNTKIDSVIAKYELYLSSFTMINKKAEAEYYFGSKSIFEKFCPRSVAEKINTGWHQFRNARYINAIEIFSSVLSETNNYSALVGKIVSLEKIDSLNPAIRLLEKSLEKYTGAGSYYGLSFRLADFYCKDSQFGMADSIYNIIVDKRPVVVLENLSYFRKILIKRNLVAQYLNGSDLDKYSILRELNKGKYIYQTFPAMIELSKSLNENYDKFKKQFENNLSVNDFYSSYAVFKLSQYMLANHDFDFARRLAGLAVRYKDDWSHLKLAQSNFTKANWIYENSNKHLAQINFSSVE